MKRSERGQSLVETTLILAAFMGMLFGMVGIGGSLFARQTLAERAHEAARWGALNPYDPQQIRSVVLYGTAVPERDAQRFLGLSEDDVSVTTPGCPGVNCRVSVDIARHSVDAVEPVECSAATCDVLAKPSDNPQP